MNEIQFELVLSLGGARILIEVKYKNIIKQSMAEDMVQHWVLDIKEWKIGQIPKQRIIWLSVLGLPQVTWGEENLANWRMFMVNF